MNNHQVTNSSHTTSIGGSSNRDQIYNDYLQAYAEINKWIDALNGEISALRQGPDYNSNRKALLDRIAALVQLQSTLLYQAYTDGYSGKIDLADFEKLKTDILAKAAEIAGGKTDPKKDIEENYHKGGQIIDDLNFKIKEDREALERLKAATEVLQREIDALQDKVRGNPQAEKDLQEAIDKLDQLKNKATILATTLDSLKGALNQAMQILKALEELYSKDNPTDGDKAKADSLLADLKAIDQDFQKGQQAFNGLLPSSKEIEAVKQAIQAVRNALDPFRKQIEDNYNAAQKLLDDLYAELQADFAKIDAWKKQIAAWEQTIKDLQGKVNGNAKAKEDLEIAIKQLNALKEKFKALNQTVVTLQETLAAGQQRLITLSKLLQKETPTSDDAKQASELLIGINQINATFNNNQTQFMKGMLTSAEMQALTLAIQAVQNDLKPNPGHYDIEHSVWYIDWTSWDQVIPDGVDTVNIFVGELQFDKDGNPTIGGFGTFDEAKLQAFIKACNDKGIKVKMSLGGGGGSYDKCWELLTKENVQAFAKGLVDYCHKFGIDGIDFDFEEFDSPRQAELEMLVGTLIKDFKLLDPSLQATICTNAFASKEGEPDGVWQQHLRRILDATLDASGHTLIDRIYVMSYYNSLSEEQQWMLNWADWLNKNYDISRAQISVGLDDFDAHAYDIHEFAKWAEENGFSTAHWAFDPARPPQKAETTQMNNDHMHLLLASPA